MSKKKKTVRRLLPRMKKTLFVVFLIITAAFAGLIFRLMYIEHTSGEKYEKIVLAQQDYTNTTIPYKRGDIVDSKGNVLATSIDVYNVILDCRELLTDEENHEGITETTIDHLKDVFSDEIDEDDIRDALKDKPDSQYVVLAKGVSYEQMSAFNKLMEDEDTSDEIGGIWFEKEYERVYPYPTLASQLIGFTASGNEGVTGLENEYNSTLNGVDGRSYGYRNSDNELENTVAGPENGKTIVTSIDMQIQSTVLKAVKKHNKELSPDGDANDGSANTAVLVMNPNSGEVLSMVSFPTFSLNDPRDLSDLYTKKQLSKMDDDEQMDALNQLWQNFPVSFTYEPGSTFKPFTVSMGLETGTLKGNETFVCDGYEKFPGNVIVRCSARNGHGVETVRKALMDSCNDSLMQMSYRIGGTNFAYYQRLFGFGQRTNIDLPGEPRTDSLVFTEDQLNERLINLATNSFGQNFNTTMVQLASGFCSLINGGTLYQPHVVTKIEDDAGNTVKTIDPVVQKKTISANTSKKIRSYLKSVVQEGTGNTAAVEGYSIGGKTGTAEKQPRGTGNYLVSFIGFAPAENPQVLVYVVVNEPNVEDQAHSTYAQEIAHDIFKSILPYMNIDKEESDE